MSLLEELGTTPLVNAAGTYSRLGSPRMPAEVLRAMAEVSGVFLDLAEFQRSVNRRVATLTGNAAAFVCAGAAAGIYLATLACLTGEDPELAAAALRGDLARLPRREILILAAHRNPYDIWTRLAGGELVQVSGSSATRRSAFTAALSLHTAAVLYMAGGHYAKDGLSLIDVIADAHAGGVPVIVDAAAQLPPASNLHSFTAIGADLVIFSGGKALRGPGGSGIIVGRPDLIRAIEAHATPHNRLGRAMKITKEDLAGLLAALERFLAQDEVAERERCEALVARWADGLRAITGVSARREFPGEAAKPLPRLRVELDLSFRIDGAGIAEHLREDSPPIAIGVGGERVIYLNPETVDDAEAGLVLAAVRKALSRAGGQTADEGAT